VQRTALNLTAIGIFSLTMLMLLSPALRIPQAIPVGLTFGLLVGFTADRFAWQGRGLTLLLDWVAGWSSDHRDRVLHHEAGHFLAAYVLGIPIAGYTLSAWEAWRSQQPGAGGVQFDTTSLEAAAQSPASAQHLLDRFCTVWMAGAAAEARQYGDAEGGDDDRQQLRAALALFGRPPSEARAKQQWAYQQARALLDRHAAAYESLVAALRQRAPVAECCEQLAAAIAQRPEGAIAETPD